MIAPQAWRDFPEWTLSAIRYGKIGRGYGSKNRTDFPVAFMTCYDAGCHRAVGGRHGRDTR